MHTECPKCKANPLIYYMRGEIYSRKLYCDLELGDQAHLFTVIICSKCKTIIGHELRKDIPVPETVEDLAQDIGYHKPKYKIFIPTPDNISIDTILKSHDKESVVDEKRMFDMDFGEFKEN